MRLNRVCRGVSTRAGFPEKKPGVTLLRMTPHAYASRMCWCSCNLHTSIHTALCWIRRLWALRSGFLYRAAMEVCNYTHLPAGNTHCASFERSVTRLFSGIPARVLTPRNAVEAA